MAQWAAADAAAVAADRELLAAEMTVAIRKILAAANGYKKEAEGLRRAAKRANGTGAKALEADAVEEDTLRAGKEATASLPSAISTGEAKPSSGEGGAGRRSEAGDGAGTRTSEVQLLTSRGSKRHLAPGGTVWLALLVLLIVCLWAIAGFAAIIVWSDYSVDRRD